MLPTTDTSPFPLTIAMQNGASRGVIGAEEGATSEGQPAGPDGAGGATPGGIGTMFLPIMLGIMLLFIITSITSGRKQKKEREQLMSSLGKHDKVQTTAGIIGTIVELKDDSVLLRVDEASNTRIRFARSAVMSVLHSAGKGSTAEPDPLATDDATSAA